MLRKKTLKATCIADTHGLHRNIRIPQSDLLLCAGDLTMTGELDILEDFNKWIGELKIPTFVIPGNHDRSVPSNPQVIKGLLYNCTLLIEESARFNGLRIYGSPWTPWFGGHYWVYNAHRGPDIRGKWNRIPKDTDILITHGPPFEVLDEVERISEGQGCKDLLDTVRRIKPKLHVFGHLHLHGGETTKVNGCNTLFVNAAICNEEYKPINYVQTVEVKC